MKIHVCFYGLEKKSQEYKDLVELLEGRGYVKVKLDDTSLLLQDSRDVDATPYENNTFIVQGSKRKYPLWAEWGSGSTMYGHYTTDIPPTP